MEHYDKTPKAKDYEQSNREKANKQLNQLQATNNKLNMAKTESEYLIKYACDKKILALSKAIYKTLKKLIELVNKEIENENLRLKDRHLQALKAYYKGR